MVETSKSSSNNTTPQSTLPNSSRLKKPTRKNSSSEISEINSSDVETDKMEDIDEAVTNNKPVLDSVIENQYLEEPKKETEDEFASDLAKLAKETEKRKLVQMTVDDEANPKTELNKDDGDEDVAAEEDEVDDDDDDSGIKIESSNIDEHQVKRRKTHTDSNQDNESDEEIEQDEDHEQDEEEEDNERGEDEEDDVVDELAKKKKHDDEMKENIRVEALNSLKTIEIEFANLKDKLYETQLNKLKFELKLCELNKHPDFLNYLELIENQFQLKIEKYINLQKYKLKCLDNQTKATRVAIHQQFLKNSQDFKNEEIMGITSNWYEINKERRLMDNLALNLPDYYQFNSHINAKNVTKQESINELVIKRNSLFDELSLLKGVTKFHGGLPSSLNDLKQCSKDEINDDLKELGLL